MKSNRLICLVEKILSQDGIQTVELLQLIALFGSYRRIERRERKGPAREYMKKMDSFTRK